MAIIPKDAFNLKDTNKNRLWNRIRYLEYRVRELEKDVEKLKERETK